VIPKVRAHRIEASVALAILLIGLTLAIFVPAFYRPGNLIDLVLANLPILIVAIGVTLVLLSGQIDISSGSLFAVCGIAAGALAVRHVPLPLAVVSALAIGAAAGAVSGALVAYASVPSIVATLAAMVVLRDGLRWITQGAWVAGLPPGFQWLGLSQATYPIAAIGLTMALTISVGWALRFLHAGRAIYATGSNPQAARLAAVDVRALTFGVFVAAGALTGLAAVVNAARFNQIPSNSGLGLELRAIAAVVVGGTAVSGGRGSIAGTVLGVALLGLISPALTFLGASPYWEQALQGAIILTAVIVDAAGARRAAARHVPRGEAHRARA
jgi:ribose/xylose/arabinose/galactoside ABC-type transport system permease subunit